jgi:hypothetical protein
MSFNLFASPTQDDIKVGYVDPTLGYVEDVTICEANSYAKDNPGTTFIFRDGNNIIRYLNINEVNGLTVNDLKANKESCEGIQVYKECGPPTIQFFGGGGIGAAGNPIIGVDGSLLAVDVVRGGHGYEYAPIVAAKDPCQFGNGTVLTAILGETADQIEVFEGEEDYEEYELCEDTDVGYGLNYGLDGQVLGNWEPGTYTRVGTDPIKREIEIYQKALEKPFWTTRKFPADKINTSETALYSNPFNVTHPEWGEFMNTYAISPVKPSETTGSDESGITFSMEWEQNFPITGEYIFRGTCDNTAIVYIDGQSVGKLDSFKSNPRAMQKTIEEGNHVIRIDLTNAPVYETITTTTPNLIDVDFKVYGAGAYKDLAFTFTSSDGKDSFTIKGAQKNKETRTETIKIRPNVTYKVKAIEDSKKHKFVEQGLIKNGSKAKEAGLGTSDKIFADYTTSGNDNDDIQITVSQGTFTSSNKKQLSEGRNTYDLNFKIPSNSTNTASTTTSVEVISSKSWQQNPMGVSMIIDAPFPPIPQEQPPLQTGRCPPNPIWSTRFPNSSPKWYPVRFTENNSWSEFMNRYAISPVLPLNTPGSDQSGTNFSTSWQVDLPYAGFYGVKGTRDNNGRLLIDGKEVSTLDGFNVSNPKLRKVYLTKGRHTITVEVSNTPVTTSSTVDTKIFSTQDWRSSLSGPTTTTTAANIKAKFILQGANAYLQVDGSGSGNISFQMDVNDNPYLYGLAAKEIFIPSDSGGVRLKRNPISEKDSDSGNSKFTGGKKYGPIQIVGASPSSRGPIVNNSNVLGIRDADGDDQNIKITIGDIKPDQVTSTPPSTGGTSVSLSKNGVTYTGPSLFGYIDSRWSKYMNEFSVSPKVFNSASSPENPVIGKYTLTWKNVNFPQNGMYKFNFQADNNATLKVGGREIFKTSDFVGNKVQYTFNITAGKYDVVIELENVKSQNGGQNEFIFEKNPMGTALFISKDIVSTSTNQTPWTNNPMAVSAILIPPPCAKKIGGKGVVEKVIVNDPGNGYLQPSGEGTYTTTLVLDEVIVENPGINYRCGEDPIQITPSNGVVLDYVCDSFGRISEVKVLNPGVGFNVYPEITIPSETGVNVKFRPVFRVIRDPIVDILQGLIEQEKLIQVTDLVGLKQTGYVEGRAYYGAVYYDEGARYAGYYKTVGTQVRVYDTLQESVTAQVTTPASAIQRSGTDVTSNDPRLNIPGTPESTTEQA